MRIHVRTVIDVETGAVIYDESYFYEGPLALADRSIQADANANSKTAGTVAGGYGSAAQGIGGQLTPELEREAANPIGYTPTQMNAQLVAGEQGAGGANASIAGEAGLAAGRTRNSGALSGVLDAAARAKGQQLSENALNVQNRSADVGLERQAQAQKMLAGLYGTDVSAQLGGMGIQNQDLNTAIQAGNSGWLQNAEGVGNTLANMGTAAAKVATAFG